MWRIRYISDTDTPWIRVGYVSGRIPKNWIRTGADTRTGRGWARLDTAQRLNSAGEGAPGRATAGAGVLRRPPQRARRGSRRARRGRAPAGGGAGVLRRPPQQARRGSRRALRGRAPAGGGATASSGLVAMAADGIWGREERRDWGGREPWRAGEKVERERRETTGSDSWRVEQIRFGSFLICPFLFLVIIEHMTI